MAIFEILAPVTLISALMWKIVLTEMVHNRGKCRILL